MELNIFDKDSILNYELLSAIVNKMMPGSVSFVINVYKNENNHYVVHYESDVMKLQINPRLFVVPVSFTNQKLDEKSKVAHLELFNVNPRVVILLRRPRPKQRPRQ
jgi:hypothetical protein